VAENPYFQIETVFERFDKFKKGHLIPDDFSEFMLENKIYPTETELYLIFRDFDKDRVGVVTLQRLIQELLPKENAKLNKKALDRKYYVGGVRLEIDL
jgi:Ca2+-binding EF-hand superfamily protein